jgi:anti-anti-sigma regulatory factor
MSIDQLASSGLASAYRVTTRSYGGVAVVGVKGALDVTSSRHLAAGLGTGPGNDSVLFDLTKVSAVEPVGIAVLLGVIWKVHEEGGGVAVASSQARIRESLRGYGIDRLVYLADSPVLGLGWLSNFREELQRLSRYRSQAEGDSSA